MRLVAGSDVAHTVPAGEQVVNFLGGRSGASANAGIAESARHSASNIFMAAVSVWAGPQSGAGLDECSGFLLSDINCRFLTKLKLHSLPYQARDGVPGFL